MKKLIAVLLALTLVLSLAALTGCGKKDDAAADTTADTEPDDTAKAEVSADTETEVTA